MTNSTAHDDPEFAPPGSTAAKEIRPAIAAELADGERLVWVGHPWRKPGEGVVPTSTRACAAVVGGIGALLGLAPISAHVFDPIRNSAANLVFGGMIISAGVGLAGLGIWDLILARFPGPLAASLPDPIRRWYEWREANTFYALTDRRVILWGPAPSGLRSVQVRSIRAKDLSGTSRTQRADGSGDLALEVVGAHSNEVAGPRTVGRLRRLEKVREVDVLVRATLLPD